MLFLPFLLLVVVLWSNMILFLLSVSVCNIYKVKVIMQVHVLSFAFMYIVHSRPGGLKTVGYRVT